MQKLFKNGNLIDLETGETQLVDLVVEDGIFTEISKVGKINTFDGETEELNGNFVMPVFVNAYADSLEAFKKSYFPNEIEKDMQEKIHQLMLVKNVLAGAFCHDISKNRELLLQNVDEKEEKELSNFVNFASKTRERCFVKVGQTLEELGTIDLQYKKSLPYDLEDFGVLDRSPVVVGGNCFEKDDLEVFSNYDCDFCMLPAEDGKLGRRPTNLISLLRKNFCVALGSGSSFEIDFFAFMRQILMTQRGLFENHDILDEKDVLKMVTFDGAKVLRLESYGLKKGNFANFIVVSKNESLYSDLLKSLVWEKSKKDVVMTVQNGEILQKNGEIFMKNMPNYDTIISDIKQKLC